MRSKRIGSIYFLFCFCHNAHIGVDVLFSFYHVHLEILFKFGRRLLLLLHWGPFFIFATQFYYNGFYWHGCIHLCWFRYIYVVFDGVFYCCKDFLVFGKICILCQIWYLVCISFLLLLLIAIIFIAAALFVIYFIVGLMY